jgi:hypothetical protein
VIYVVLGMHKSGTTLVSQTLHKSGISMGREFDESRSYDQGNQWERRESWLINLEIVGAVESGYFSLDRSTRHTGAPTPRIADRMRALIAAGSNEADDWGFKDPLSCLTYEQWAHVLPEHRVIAVYRDPGAVMRHYRCRRWDVVRAWRVLRAWSQYNRGVTDALERAGRNGLCLRYEALMSDEAEFERLRQFVGRDLADMRRASSQRAHGAHRLRRPVGTALALKTGTDPERILARLDGLRRASV